MNHPNYYELLWGVLGGASVPKAAVAATYGSSCQVWPAEALAPPNHTMNDKALLFALTIRANHKPGNLEGTGNVN